MRTLILSDVSLGFVFTTLSPAVFFLLFLSLLSRRHRSNAAAHNAFVGVQHARIYRNSQPRISTDERKRERSRQEANRRRHVDNENH